MDPHERLGPNQSAEIEAEYLTTAQSTAKMQVRSGSKSLSVRERGKKLPEGVDFWDFDCKFGATAESAKKLHLAEFNTFIDGAEKQQLESFYVEILAKPGRRTKKPEVDGKPTTSMDELQ